jgi:hypothetical protein
MLGCTRVMGNYQNRFTIITHELVQEIQNLIGAGSIKVTGWFITEKKGRI